MNPPVVSSSVACSVADLRVVARLGVLFRVWLGGGSGIVQFGGTFRIGIGRRDHSY